MGREIVVQKTNSKDVGGCNACSEYVSSTGTEYHTVWRICLGCTEVRVCCGCREELIKKLRATNG